MLAWALALPALAQEVSHPALRDELLQLGERDQRALKSGTANQQELAGLQAAHTRRLQEIVRQHGWPALSMVGSQAAQGAWLLAQHEDANLAWQREALAQMEKLLPSKQVSRMEVAYLRDRVAVNSGGKQSYGTQGSCVAAGVWQPKPVDAPEQLAQRRAEMDMQPMAAYVKMASERICRNWKPADGSQ